MAYCNADADQNGVLTADEVIALCESMGLPAESDEQETLSKMDEDGSNTVSMEEWLGWWLNRVARVPNPMKQQEVIANSVFNRFDVDGSDTIDATELKDLIESLGAEFSEEELEDTLQLLDVDSSGTIDRDEFLAWWTQRSAQLRYGASSVAIKLRKLQSRAAQRFSTSIFAAAWEGDVEIVRAFLNAEPRQCSAADPDNDDWTPLHCAAYQGQMAMIESLMSSNSNVNRSNLKGFTPLFYAAQQGHVEAVKLLLDSGADPTLWGTEGDIWMSPLDHCVDTPELYEVFQSHSKCEVLDLAECTAIDVSLKGNGTISILLPATKSIGPLPVKQWEIKLLSQEPHFLSTTTVDAKVPSERQSLTLQLEKSKVEEVVKLISGGSLQCTVAAVDPLKRKSVFSPLIDVK